MTSLTDQKLRKITCAVHALSMSLKSRNPFNIRAESWLRTKEDFSQKNFPSNGKQA